MNNTVVLNSFILFLNQNVHGTSTAPTILLLQDGLFFVQILYEPTWLPSWHHPITYPALVVE